MPAGPTRLPFRENCTIDRRKLTDYLLAEARRDEAASKVGLIRDVLGFSDPDRLEASLIEHARRNEATIYERRPDRTLYNVAGPLEGPRGSVGSFVSAWQIVDGTNEPRLVTVALAPRRRRA
jgi:hypothetical protein